MLRFLPAPLRGVLAGLILLANTLIFCWPLFIGALLKAALPFAGAQRSINYWVHACAQTWIAVNKGWMDLVQPIQWDVQGLESVDMQHSYLVTSNHQSWVDILILQYQLNRKAPFLKFFLKQELIWVPVIGLCWWALDFPFMKRKGGGSAQKDLETARKACEKFRVIPTSVISFMEGTRFTQAKHDQQRSPYQNLLKPKSGGVGMALETMGEMFDCMLDITIVYPHGVPTFTDLLMGRVDEVVVTVKEVKIPQEVLVDERGQAPSRATVQTWIQGLWEAKDREISEIKARYQAK